MVISDNEIDTMKFNYNLWIKLNDSVSRHLVSVMLPLNEVRWWIKKKNKFKATYLIIITALKISLIYHFTTHCVCTCNVKLFPHISQAPLLKHKSEVQVDKNQACMGDHPLASLHDGKYNIIIYSQRTLL